MNKSKIWLFRCLSIIICGVLMLGPVGGGMPVQAKAQPIVAGPLPELSAPVSQQASAAPMVSQPLTSTVSNAGTSPDEATNAAAIDALLAPSSPDGACTNNPMSSVTLVHRDDIVTYGTSSAYRQPSYGWSTWSGNLSTGLSNTPVSLIGSSIKAARCIMAERSRINHH